MLLSHFHPWCQPSRTIPGVVASAECLGTAAAAEAETEGSLSTWPCAGGEKGESSGGGDCVFCNIVAGTAQAFKVSLLRAAAARSQLIQPFCV